MYLRFFFIFICQLILIGNVYADKQASESFQQVQITDPYIDMHTGPGGGYPIFHVIERGELIEIIQRRTSWFKVRYNNNLIGWISIEQMEQTLSLQGDKTEITDTTHEDFVNRRWEMGAMFGGFGNAGALTAFGAYQFNKGFSVEIDLSQAIGNNSSSFLYNLGLIMQPFPEWKLSPYLHLGTGVINVDPKTTNIRQRDLSNQFSNIGIGARMYLTKQIVFRLEFSQYVLFTAGIDKDTNEDINEWKAGFAVFF